VTRSRHRTQLRASALALGIWMLASGALRAQRSVPTIGPFVVDVQGTALSFPRDEALANSRNLQTTEMPGFGIGGHLGAHVYPFRWRALTLGLGGHLTLARARHVPSTANGQAGFGRSVTERFVSLAPQVSFNFGTGDGWSYLSGGLGGSVWQIVPDGQDPIPADEERLKTIDYGGGARWFTNRHVAFSFDARFYAINPGTPAFGFPGSPRTTLFIIGAGISVK
jgi:hypothetical protein